MSIIEPIPTTSTETAIHLFANLAVGGAMAVGLTLTESPWAVGIGISFAGIPLSCAGMQQAAGYGLGLGLLGRAVRNIQPLVKLVQSGAPLPEAMGTYTTPALQLVFGLGWTAAAVRQESRVCFNQDKMATEEKQALRACAML